MRWVADNWFRLGMLVVGLIIAASAAYYFVVFFPNMEKARLAFEKEESLAAEKRRRAEKDEERKALEEQRQAQEEAEIARQDKLDACLADQYSSYTDRWKKSCKRLGLKSDCALPGSLANDYDEDRKAGEAMCVKRYK